MNRRTRLRLYLGGALIAALVFVVWDPRAVIKPDLQNNLIAEALGAIVTLLIVDFAFEADAERDQRRALVELRRTIEHTLDADLHALWSLLLPDTVARDDPVRRATRTTRIERFVSELSTPALWANAPPAHAKAARARVRDLGEDAERLLVLAENVASIDERVRLDALRRACRALDEGWQTLPRGQLSTQFATTIAPEVREVVAKLSTAN